MGSRSYCWSLATSRQASEEACHFLSTVLEKTFTSRTTRTISRHADGESSEHFSFLYQSSELVEVGMRKLLRVDVECHEEDREIAGKNTPQQFIRVSEEAEEEDLRPFLHICR